MSPLKIFTYVCWVIAFSLSCINAYVGHLLGALVGGGFLVASMLCINTDRRRRSRGAKP